uniref:Uncharacterized protein n=1 Tax=Moniliophthora roreri TaxID=221103 RepID=A0A0W0FA41_MONRR
MQSLSLDPQENDALKVKTETLADLQWQLECGVCEEVMWDPFMIMEMVICSVRNVH